MGACAGGVRSQTCWAGRAGCGQRQGWAGIPAALGKLTGLQTGGSLARTRPGGNEMQPSGSPGSGGKPGFLERDVFIEPGWVCFWEAGNSCSALQESRNTGTWFPGGTWQRGRGSKQQRSGWCPWRPPSCWEDPRSWSGDMRGHQVLHSGAEETAGRGHTVGVRRTHPQPGSCRCKATFHGSPVVQGLTHAAGIEGMDVKGLSLLLLLCH